MVQLNPFFSKLVVFYPNYKKELGQTAKLCKTRLMNEDFHANAQLVLPICAMCAYKYEIIYPLE